MQGPPRTSRCATSAATGPGSALGHFPSASPAVKPHQGSAWDSAGEGERRTLRAAPRAFLALLEAPVGAELAAEEEPPLATLPGRVPWRATPKAAVLIPVTLAGAME